MFGGVGGMEFWRGLKLLASSAIAGEVPAAAMASVTVQKATHQLLSGAPVYRRP